MSEGSGTFGYQGNTPAGRAINDLRAALIAAESRAQAAEARAAMLERAAARAISAVVWKDGYCPYCTTLPEQRHTHTPQCPIFALAALVASPSPLAQAIEGVLGYVGRGADMRGWDADELLEITERVDALRTAWRGAERETPR